METLAQDTNAVNKREPPAAPINIECVDHDITLESDEYPNTNMVLPNGTENGELDIINEILPDSSRDGELNITNVVLLDSRKDRELDITHVVLPYSSKNIELDITDVVRLENDIVEQTLTVIPREDDEKCIVCMESTCDVSIREISILHSCNHPYY